MMLRRLTFRLHRTARRRLQSLHDTNGEATEVVKGTNRRVVVVRSPDERIFEQAIFILRDDYLQTEREGSKRLLEEARRAAGAYTARLRTPRKKRRIFPLAAMAGVAGAALVYLAVHYAGVLF